MGWGVFFIYTAGWGDQLKCGASPCDVSCIVTEKWMTNKFRVFGTVSFLD